MKKVNKSDIKRHEIHHLGCHLSDIADEYGEVMCDLTVESPEGFYPLAKELYEYFTKRGWTPPSPVNKGE